MEDFKTERNHAKKGVADITAPKPPIIHKFTIGAMPSRQPLLTTSSHFDGPSKALKLRTAQRMEAVSMAPGIENLNTLKKTKTTAIGDKDTSKRGLYPVSPPVSLSRIS